MPYLPSPTLLKRFLCIVYSLFAVISSKAQLHGNYTIDPLTAASATNYQTLTAAISDLRSGIRTDGGTPNGAGVSGAVIFELAGGYTSSGEMFPLTFGAITGTGSSNTITIRPASGVSSALNITSSNATATIDLNGVTYVIFDGRPGGAGTSKFLTIDNSSTSGAAVRLINDASANTVQYCTLSGVNTSTTSGVVLFSTTSGATGSDNNTIDNCDIRDGASTPVNAVYSVGTAGKENSGNTISNDNIYNFFSATVSSGGIVLASGNDSWTISGNSLYQTSSRTATTANLHRGIQLASGNGHVITGNYIGGSTAGAGGTAWTCGPGTLGNRFIGIDMSVGTASASSVQNNTIANFNWSTNNTNTTVNGIFCGINVTNGNVDIGTSTGNTIGNASAGSIAITQGATGGSANLVSCSSTGTVNIANNTIGSVTSSGASTSISASITGMFLSGSGTKTISNNTIGSSSVPNSINAGTASTSTTAQFVTGISSSASGTINIINNTIANLNNNYAGSATTAQIRGIVSTNGVNTITGNTIYNLSTSSANTSVSASASVIGISFTSILTGGSQLISQNIIHSLSNTASSAAVTVTGIYATGPSGGTHVISRNFVHSLSISSVSTSCVMNGIQIAGGTGITYQNNMVRLGIDASGNSVTSGFSIYGIYQNVGSSINIYHNSVYIGGSGVSSSSKTAAYYRSQTSAAATILNNIFANARSNSSGTGINYAIYISNATDYTTPYLTVNNNVYQASGTGGVLAAVSTTDYASFNLWRSTTGFDMASGTGSPGFVNATGNASAVDLHVSGSSPVEGAGSTATGVTDDYDGSARSGLTPTDIGADAGNFTFSDAFTPYILYTAFASNTTSTSNRTVSNVNITDIGTGVPTSGSNRPRIWFRRSAPSASSWASTAGTLNTGDGNSGTWSFTIDYALLAITPALGETYQYYIVAQDQATTPFLDYNPENGAAHTDVNTQISAPATPYSYTIVSGLPTTINVGTSQTYTSLTGSGGLFEAINAAALTGNTIVHITSDLGEDGTNELTPAGLAGYTLTIQPDAAALRTISNSTDLSVPMIRLNGVAGVTIDGRFGGSGQYFRIVNTNITAISCQAAVEVLGSSTTSTIRNCIIETNSGNGTQGDVLIGSGTNTGITILNNDIRDAQGTPGTAGIPTSLIYSSSTTNVVTIQDNNVYNFTTCGIKLFSIGDGCTVSGNNVYYNASTVPAIAQTGIYIGGGNNHTVSGNYVGGQSAGCGGSAWINSGNTTFTGIQLNVGTVTPSSVQNNTVQNISLTGTGGVNFNGILISTGSANVGTITGNLVGHASTANSITNTGGNSLSVTLGIGTASSGVTVISNNTVANITSSSSTTTTNVGVRGISNTGTGQCTVSGNTIYNLTAQAATNGVQAAPVGILTNSSNNSQLITKNTIYNLSNSNTTAVNAWVLGIGTNSPSGAGTIDHNRIYALSNSATGGTPVLSGIYIATASAWSVVNNQISITNGGNTNSVVVSGIRDNSSGTNSHYYNSVYIGGAVSSGTNNSYAFLRSGAATTTLRNNLFYNERSGGTGAYYAIGNIYGTPANNWLSATSNYNLYVAPDLNALGEWGTGNAKSFTQWQTISGGDMISYTESSTTLTGSRLFTAVATGDLSIVTANAEAWYINGKGIAGTESDNTSDDYTGDTRSTTVGTPTDIGSDEIDVNSGVLPPAATASAAPAAGTTTTYTFAGRKLGEITWGPGGTVPSSVSFLYYSGENPPSFGASTRFNAYYEASVPDGSGFTYDIKLYYTDAEQKQLSDAGLTLFKQSGVTTNPWTNISGTPSSDAAGKYIATSGLLLNSFSRFTGAPASALPVSLISLTGYTEGNHNILNWVTAIESNNRGFEILRSANGIDYGAIGFVNSQVGNNAGLKNYSFTDNAPLPGKQYYRLRQVDIDGQSKLSNVILLNSTNTASFVVESVFPNPAKDKVNISIVSTKSSKVTVTITDMTGNVVMQQVASVNTGSNIISLATNRLRSGSYLARLFFSGEDKGHAIKILKQ